MANIWASFESKLVIETLQKNPNLAALISSQWIESVQWVSLVYLNAIFPVSFSSFRLPFEL